MAGDIYPVSNRAVAIIVDKYRKRRLGTSTLAWSWVTLKLPATCCASPVPANGNSSKETQTLFIIDMTASIANPQTYCGNVAPFQTSENALPFNGAVTKPHS
jgi:hypothetical protein